MTYNYDGLEPTSNDMTPENIIHSTEQVDKVVNWLNDLLKEDTDLVETLINNRVVRHDSCKILDDDYLTFSKVEKSGYYKTSGLGLINGLLGLLKIHRICAMFDEQDKLLGFRKL